MASAVRRLGGSSARGVVGRGGDAGCADGRGAKGDPAAADDRKAAGGADAPSKRKGHGRIGGAEYPHARCIHVEHDHLHVGDICTRCSHGKLYLLREPERILRTIGQPPLVAHTRELDRFRCSGCGDVFTARAPAEAQGPKYDQRAVAIIALLRYRAGMPLNRLGRLQRNLETPYPHRRSGKSFAITST